MDVNDETWLPTGATTGDDDEVGDRPGSDALPGSGAPDDDPAAAEADVPTLRARLEALLLVVDQPTGEAALASAAEVTPDRVERELLAWRAELIEAASGIDLRRTGEGWRLYTRRELAPYVERLLTDGTRSTLTRAALETLAVIAYRQPTTRSRVAAVRGVNVDGVMRTLVARGLAVECGTDPETGGLLYRTTELFLERLGLASLEELPDIAPLLPDIDLVDEMSDDPAEDPRIPVGRRRHAAPDDSVPDDPAPDDPVTDDEEM